ncbi:MAG: hypothetical protein AB8B91_19835 [Rubripirellula sp.]
MNPPVFFPHPTFCSPTSGKSLLIPSAVPKNDPGEALPDIAKTLRANDVRAILLVHGTFAGNDIFGLVREVTRLSPRLAGKMREIGKRWFDDLAGEVGNFSESYAEQLGRLVNPTSAPPIAIERFSWSGENHHLGRADGAMRLINRVGEFSSSGRVLIMAHSHGGNLVAMLSQLIGSDAATQHAFFQQTRLHYRLPVSGRIDLPSWSEAQQRIKQPLAKLDVVTMGTPLRYGWNVNAVEHLMHFVHHRPQCEDDPTRAEFPDTVNELVMAAGGDYVQHLGIAGTDFLPSVFAWRDWLVERRMRKMFESKVRRRDLLKNLKRGRRVSDAGMTLLVDYADGDRETGLSRKLLGHGVYTCSPWLVFHLQQIVDHFYRDVTS